MTSRNATQIKGGGVQMRKIEISLDTLEKILLGDVLAVRLANEMILKNKRICVVCGKVFYYKHWKDTVCRSMCSRQKSNG